MIAGTRVQSVVWVLAGGEQTMNGKYISTGAATATGDADEATRSALADALEQLDDEPTFVILYCNADYDPEVVAEVAGTALRDTPWIGISTDKSYLNGDLVDGVVALALSSEYMHFGVAVAEDYRDEPRESAQAATKAAMEAVQVGDYVDAYVQFKRTQTAQYDKIVRTPPYFMLVFPSGAEIKDGEHLPGAELELIEGIISQTGPHIPIFGGSASSDFEQYVGEGVAENFQIVNGTVYQGAAIIAFVVCNLYFSNKVMHGYTRTHDFAAVTKRADNGHDILELNGRPPIEEYARILDVEPDDIKEDPIEYCLKYPFALVDFNDRTLVREALPNEDGESLHATFSIPEGAALNVLKFDEDATLNTIPAILDEQAAEMQPAVSMICECVGRKPLIDDIETKEMDLLDGAYKFPVFGFYSFGEIGSYGTQSPQAHSQTVTSLAIYDKLLAEM